MEDAFDIGYVVAQNDRIRQEIEELQESFAEFRDEAERSREEAMVRHNEIIMILSHLKPAVDQTAGSISGLIQGIREMNAQRSIT